MTPEIATSASQHKSLLTALERSKLEAWTRGKRNARTLVQFLMEYVANTTLPKIASHLHKLNNRDKAFKMIMKVQPFFVFDGRVRPYAMEMWGKPEVHDMSRNGGVRIPSQLYFFLGPPPLPPPPLLDGAGLDGKMSGLGEDALFSIRKSDTHGMGVFANKDVGAGEVLFEIKLHPEDGVVRSQVSELLRTELGKTIPVSVGDNPAFLVLKRSDGCPLHYINHSSSDNNKMSIRAVVFENSDMSVKVVAATKLKKGSECFAHYGHELMARIIIGDSSEDCIASACEVLMGDANTCFYNKSDDSDTKMATLMDTIAPGELGGLSNAQKQVYMTFWGGMKQRDFAHTDSGYPIAHYRLNHADRLVVNKQPAKSPPTLTSFGVKEITHQLCWWGRNVEEIERLGLNCIVNDEERH